MVTEKLLDTLCLDDYLFFVDLLHPAMQVSKRTGAGKQVLSIEKKMHRYDSYRHGGPPAVAAFNRNTFQMPLAAPTFAGDYNSATNTPPLFTADTQPLHNSGLPGISYDAVEGATVSRKGSEQSAGTGTQLR